MLKKMSKEELEDLVISIVNCAIDEKLHSKLTYKNVILTETPKISSTYDNSTTYQLDLASGCQDITHETTPFLAIILTPPHSMEGNDISVNINEPVFQFNNSLINLAKI